MDTISTGAMTIIFSVMFSVLSLLVTIAIFISKEILKQLRDLKKELCNYVTEKQCEAHRAMLQAQIDNLAAKNK